MNWGCGPCSSSPPAVYSFSARLRNPCHHASHLTIPAAPCPTHGRARAGVGAGRGNVRVPARPSTPRRFRRRVRLRSQRRPERRLLLQRRVRTAAGNRIVEAALPEVPRQSRHLDSRSRAVARRARLVARGDLGSGLEGAAVPRRRPARAASRTAQRSARRRRRPARRSRPGRDAAPCRFPGAVLLRHSPRSSSQVRVNFFTRSGAPV